MRRRGVLHIGVTGLAAMLAQGCAGGSGVTRSGGGSGSAGPSPAASRFDPSAYSPPAIAIDELRKLFAYDSKSFLDAVLTDQREGGGVLVEDLTISDTKGDTIPLYVISPQKLTGRLPGVVFAHGGGAGRDTWLAEATDLAKRGLVALLPQLPYAPDGDPAHDSTMVIKTVIAQRRALDLLARRSDTDPGRLAFVGHSWGASQAAILAGVEPRLSGVAVVAGGSRLSQYLAATVKTADPIAYLNALTRFDGARYVSAPGKRAVLLQFGGQDPNVPAAQAAELTAGTAGSKERKDYNAGHDLVAVPAAAADRLVFLKRVLRLR